MLLFNICGQASGALGCGAVGCGVRGRRRYLKSSFGGFIFTSFHVKKVQRWQMLSLIHLSKSKHIRWCTWQIILTTSEHFRAIFTRTSRTFQHLVISWKCLNSTTCERIQWGTDTYSCNKLSLLSQGWPTTHENKYLDTAEIWSY